MIGGVGRALAQQPFSARLPHREASPPFGRIDALTGALENSIPSFSLFFSAVGHKRTGSGKHHVTILGPRRWPRHAGDAMIGTWPAEVGLGVSQRVLAHFRSLVSCRARVICCAPDGAPVLEPGCAVRRRSTLRCSDWRQSQSGHPAKHSQRSEAFAPDSQYQLKQRACAGQ